MKSIFIQLAAYHDHELGRTINDCIQKSSGEYDIKFGVHLCYYKNDEISIPNLKNVKIKKVMAPEGLGVGYARCMANQFYNNEDYYLQIDSHTRFAPNWDKDFISTYNKYFEAGCNPVLTSYPSGYHYENFKVVLDKNPTVVFADFVRTKKSQENFLQTNFLHQESKQNEEGNIFTRAVSGGEIFSSGNIANIQPNTKMFNWGEEFLTAIRFFTHGYDLMLPEKQSLYHLYYDDPIKSQRRMAGEDFPSENNKISLESNDEIGRIINNKIIGDFEMGSKRTLEDFGRYAEIDFGKKTLYPMV